MASKRGPTSISAGLLDEQVTAAAPPPFAVVANRYRLDRALGEGAMAVVYRAHDKATGKRVAVKLLKPKVIKNSDAMARFEVEVKAHRSASHPHLVEFIDAGLHQGLPYLTMEWVPGPSLKAWVEQHGPLSPNLALKLFAQVARGLGSMHREGMLHRDVKPQNVLLALKQGQPNVSKLSDLGFAKVPSMRRLTRSGDFVGTAAYMAPEQIVQDPLDARADIYGLGAALYFALTGQVMFEGPVATVFVKHLHARPRHPSEVDQRLVKSVDQLVMTLVRKHPDNRYRSALAVAADIGRVVRDKPLRGIPLKVKPDRYTPTSAGGREAMAVFDELKQKIDKKPASSAAPGSQAKATNRPRPKPPTLPPSRKPASKATASLPPQSANTRSSATKAAAKKASPKRRPSKRALAKKRSSPKRPTRKSSAKTRRASKRRLSKKGQPKASGSNDG